MRQVVAYRPSTGRVLFHAKYEGPSVALPLSVGAYRDAVVEHNDGLENFRIMKRCMRCADFASVEIDGEYAPKHMRVYGHAFEPGPLIQVTVCVGRKASGVPCSVAAGLRACGRCVHHCTSRITPGSCNVVCDGRPVKHA